MSRYIPPRLRVIVGCTALFFSCLLLWVVWTAFIQQSDRFALFTVLPLWLWAFAGWIGCLISGWALRRLWIGLLVLVWLGIVLAYADETKVLWHHHGSPPITGPAPPHEGQPVIRVMTANCANFDYGNPMEDIARWHPDIILLQDCYPHQASIIRDRVFGKSGSITQSSRTTCIATKWQILRQISIAGTRSVQATIRIPGRMDLEVVSLHLTSASTDLRIWRRPVWTNHRINRAHRMAEIGAIQNTLWSSTSFPMTPVLLGGDFNASATDMVHQSLSNHLRDSFLEAGVGLGNTYHRRFPILRIDYLYHSFQFETVRAKAIESACSDHRMLVADYIISSWQQQVSPRQPEAVRAHPSQLRHDSPPSP